MLPSTENLRCFLEVARSLNFRVAARAVGLSPAALGQRVRQLEDQISEPLFVRSTRRVSLTRAGDSLLPVATRALAAAEECLHAARGVVVHPPIDLVIGTRQELGLSFVLPLLPSLEASRPSLTIHLYFGSTTDLLVRVRAFDIDCAVGSMRVTDSRLDAIPFREERYVFVAQPALLRRAPLRRAEHAARHTLVDAHADLPLFGYFRDAPGGGDRFHFKRVVRLGTIAAIREWVVRGEGVAVLPRYFVDPDLKARRLAVVFPSVTPLHDQFRLVFRRDDVRRTLFEDLARKLRAAPLR